MSLELYGAFVVATVVIILIPGPSVMLTLAHSLAHGWRRALITVAGTMAAIVLQLAVTAVGMTSLMAILAEWFEVLRWAGVAYLVYLGLRQWQADSDPATAATAARASARSLFWTGFLVSVTNPKTLFFYAAFFPQFVDLQGPLGVQMTVLCTTFLVIAATLTAGYAVLAGQIGAWFKTRRSLQVRNRVTGSLMIGAGLGLALARRA